VGSSSDGYRGQVKDGPSFKQLQQEQPALLNSVMANFAPGYVAQQRFIGQYQPKVTTVSVGGNDIGFGDILEICVAPHLSRHLSDNECFNTYEDRVEVINLINRTIPKWVKLYRQLSAVSPSTRMYVIGYPQIIDDKGSCGLNVHLNQSEREFAVELVNYLNEAISQAAAKTGAAYADISQALAGHRLCETANYNIAVNGLTAGRDAGILGLKVFGKESYHPNALGQLLIEQAILQKTRNLTVGGSAVALTADQKKLLAAPKTGRQIVNRQPAKAITPKIVNRRQATPVKIKGITAGLKPKTVYTIRLDGSNGRIIGSVKSDDKSDVDGSVEIPENIDSGGHTIDIVGDNQAGDPVDVTQPIYVPGDDNDADGDGINDSQDSCPGAVNTGIDSDHDGVDDTCDPLIGQTPAGYSASGASTGLIKISKQAVRPRNAQTYTNGSTRGTRKARTAYAPARIKHEQRLQPAKPRVINWIPWLLVALLSWIIHLIAARFSLRRGAG
jgi:lysophospholipase L1-like esterase